MIRGSEREHAAHVQDSKVRAANGRIGDAIDIVGVVGLCGE